MENKLSTISILDPVLSGGFAPTPLVVLKNPKITPQAKTLYSLLLSYAWFEAGCFPGHKRLAEDMGMSDRSVRIYLNELKDRKLIDWKQRGLTKTNYYQILELSRLERKQASTQERKQASYKVYKGKVNKDKMNNGLASRKPSLSFSSFNKVNKVESGLYQIVRFYLDNYRALKDELHPNLKPEQWEMVVEVLGEFGGLYDLSFEDWKKILLAFLNNKTLNTDHNIIHLTNGDILENRYYEVVL